MPVQDFPIPPFGKEICHHPNGTKLHNVHESAGSAVGDISIHQGNQAAIQGVQSKMIDPGVGLTFFRSIVLNFLIDVSAHARYM